VYVYYLFRKFYVRTAIYIKNINFEEYKMWINRPYVHFQLDSKIMPLFIFL